MSVKYLIVKNGMFCGGNALSLLLSLNSYFNQILEKVIIVKKALIFGKALCIFLNVDPFISLYIFMCYSLVVPRTFILIDFHSLLSIFFIVLALFYRFFYLPLSYCFRLG